MNTAAGHLRVLLVAAESEAIRGLARDLFLLDEHLETALRSEPAAALALLEFETFDLVVVDQHTPGDVTELLAAVATRFPRMIRMVVADAPGEATFARAAHLAHVLLPRPCDPGTLLENIHDTVVARRRLRDPDLTAAVAGVLALPESPAVRRELLGLLADDDITVDQLEEAIERNPAIAAKLLQLANSAYFGARGTVGSIGEAISMIGLDSVRGIVTSAHLFESMPAAGLKEFPLGDLWTHCVATAIMTRRIAWHVRASTTVNRAAFAAALLHDVGKIVMTLAHGEAYTELRLHPETPPRPFWQMEERRFGHHHGTAGALLLELWGLPRAVVEAVGLHHTPHRTRDNTVTPLALVHIANAVVHGENPAQLLESHLDAGYLQRLLLPAKLDLWQNALAPED